MDPDLTVSLKMLKNSSFFSIFLVNLFNKFSAISFLSFKTDVIIPAVNNKQKTFEKLDFFWGKRMLQYRTVLKDEYDPEP
jgi:hypothetical protein